MSQDSGNVYISHVNYDAHLLSTVFKISNPDYKHGAYMYYQCSIMYKVHTKASIKRVVPNLFVPFTL